MSATEEGCTWQTVGVYFHFMFYLAWLRWLFVAVAWAFSSCGELAVFLVEHQLCGFLQSQRVFSS